MKEICTHTQINSIYKYFVPLSWLYACNKQIKFHIDKIIVIMIVKIDFWHTHRRKVQTHTAHTQQRKQQEQQFLDCVTF